MSNLLTRLGLPQAIGVYIDERSVHLSRTVATPLGILEIARVKETVGIDSAGATIERLLTGITGRGRFSRVPVTIGLPLEHSYFISRPIQSARDDIAPLVLLREALRSSKVTIDDMSADVVKAVPDRRPVASIVACEKRFLLDIVERLNSRGIRLARVEPAVSALLRAADKQHSCRRNAKVVIRYFLGNNDGLAVLTVKGLPIVCRQFKTRRGDEATALISIGRALLTVGTHCGVESSLDAVMIHGRGDLPRLLDLAEMRKQFGTDIDWFDGPSLDRAQIAYGLALGSNTESDTAFDLARTMKPKTTLWELFPLREAAIQAALLMIMACFIIYRTQCVNHQYTAIAHENSQTIDASMTQADLENQRNILRQQVSGVQTFLQDRVIWTGLERKLAAGLPDNVYLTSFHGAAELGSNGNRGKNNASLVLRGAVSIPQNGLIPVEIDRLLNTLRENSLLKQSFPVVELAALKRLNNAHDNKSTAMFTVVCLPKGAKPEIAVHLSNTKEDLEKWAERLRDPWRMRLAVTAFFLIVGYTAIYTPLNGRLEQANWQLNQERQRREIHQDVAFLHNQVEMFESRLPTDSDTNQWVQYVIDGVRQHPVKLVNLDSAPPRTVGRYQAVAMRIDLEGRMHDLDALLHWLETNERLFRIDSAMIVPSREDETRRSMHITLLGLKA